MRTNNSLPCRDKIDLMKKLPVLLVVSGLLAMFAVPTVAGPPEREGAWGNDQQYVMLTPKVPVPAAVPAQENLYVIAPIDPGNPQSPGHGNEIGPHDHVVPIPPHNGGQFTAIWHAVLVLPGHNAVPGVNVLVRTISPPPSGVPLVYAADLDSNGIVELPAEQLTSVEKIEKAEQLGLIEETPIPVVFVCTLVKVGQVTHGT